MPGTPPPLPTPQPVLPKRYAPEAYHPDRIRAWLAFGLLVLLGLTIAFVAAQVARGYWEQTREFSEVIVTAEIALLGSAVGFYFAGREF